MREGLYTIDSIEQGLVKLLWREDEAIEEVIPFEQLGYSAKAGDIVEVKVADEQLLFIYESNQTAAIREQARKLKEELLKKNQ